MTRQGRSSKRLKFGLTLVVLVGLIMAIVVYLPIFTLQHVEVSGNQYLTQDDIMEIARIKTGQPIFQLETDAVTENLTHDLRIESATVRRRLPDTLEIAITERTPVASVATDYGYLDFDKQGKVIASYRTLKKVPIPLITGVTVHDLYVGDDNTDANIQNILSFLTKLDANTLNQISEINIANPEQIVAYTTSSVQIRLGNMERMDEKAKLTQDFIADLPNSKYPIDYVDFSYKAPFIRLKGNVPSNNLDETEENTQG